MSHEASRGATLAAVVVTSSCLCQLAIADPVRTWCYEGIVTAVPTEYFNAGLRLGDPIYGRIRFDRRALDLNSDPKIGTYTLESSLIYVPALGSLWSFEGLEVGKQMIVMSGVGTPTPYDFFEVYQRDSPLDSPIDPTRLSFFNGQAPAGTLFSSDALPKKPPPVSSFEFLNLQYTDYAVSAGASVTGTVTKLFAAHGPSASLSLECGTAAE